MAMESTSWEEIIDNDYYLINSTEKKEEEEVIYDCYHRIYSTEKAEVTKELEVTATFYSPES